MTRSLPTRIVDGVLEGSIVGSFSRIGPLVRSRLTGWDDIPRMDGRTAVITGGTSGIGAAAARKMALLGAHVIIIGRNRKRGEELKNHLHDAIDRDCIDLILGDLSDLESVKRIAHEIASRYRAIDVLVHNAGALLSEYTVTRQGIEMTVAVHLLAPFLLTHELLPELRAAPHPRIITVSSGGMYTQRFKVSELEMTQESYNGTVAYARAKRAQTVLNEEWQRQYGPEGFTFHAMHPGWVATPGIETGLPLFGRIMKPVLRTPSEGADTIVWLAAGSPGSEHGGRFWCDRVPRSLYYLPGTHKGSARALLDGKTLWKWCTHRIKTSQKTSRRD